ncbi:MAG TPA: SDR family NAD(P)-dependent oxidoreductase [Bradyrhizobium sp.]|nr:SDR family NAD(P)-dependent oxidoreductase [Bradyrhizobium sp.]
MELGLTGKVALVTGSSRGIGRGIAEMLAQEGCDLVLTGTSEQALGEAAAAVGAHGLRIETLALDLRQEEAPAALAAAVRRGWGRLDILVNNAGTTKRGDFLKLTDADWADGYALKFFAHVRLARAAWPMLKESGGSLVAIGGSSGRVPAAGFTIGSSVNSAVAAFTKALADLGKSDGVQVNCIHPSYVDTERFARRIKADMERTGQSEAAVREWHRKDIGITRIGTVADVAALVAFIVSARGRWLHGATIELDGGEVRAL